MYSSPNMPALIIYPAIYARLERSLIFPSFLQLTFSFIYTTASSLPPAPADQLLYIPISNNRPSTAPRGLQHAILKISISAELFRGTVKSVCASGNRHEPSSSQKGKTRSREEEEGEEGEEGVGVVEKIDQNWIKQNSVSRRMRISACVALASRFLTGLRRDDFLWERRGGKFQHSGKLDSSCMFDWHTEIQTRRHIVLFDPHSLTRSVQLYLSIRLCFYFILWLLFHHFHCSILFFFQSRWNTFSQTEIDRANEPIVAY